VLDIVGCVREVVVVGLVGLEGTQHTW